MTQRGKAVLPAVPAAADLGGSTSVSGKSKPKHSGMFKKGDPRINRTIPGPGRQTDRFKLWCRKLIANPKRRKQVRRVLNNANHPAYSAMWKEVAAHGHGKPSQSVEIGGKISLELADRIRAARERANPKRS
jgi:hypothetical protein